MTGAAIAAMVAVAVALVLLLALRTPASGQPNGAAPQVSAQPAVVTGHEPKGIAPTRTLKPSPSAPPGHSDPLSKAVTAYVASRSGTVIAAVYDVTTGQTWRLGNKTPQAEASVIKVDILETLLARHEHPHQRGTGLSAADQALAQAMIEESDNDAATSLWDEDGGATGIGAYNTRAKLTRTTLSTCVTCSGFPWPGWGLSTTVPADELTLLKQVVAPGAHPLLSKADRAYALSLLEHVDPTQSWGISGGVPAGVKVAVKDGWLPLDDADTIWQINSVGWIHGKGRNYLIAVFTTGNATMQYGVDTIDGLAARVWSAMR